jgi:hypothetical protein
VIDWPAICIRKQVTLTDIGDVGRVIIFGEQVIERLITPRADILWDGLVPFLGIGENRINIKNHAPELEQAVAHHVTDTEPGTGLARSNDCASGLAREELCAFHEAQYGCLPWQNKRHDCAVARYARIL